MHRPYYTYLIIEGTFPTLTDDVIVKHNNQIRRKYVNALGLTLDYRKYIWEYTFYTEGICFFFYS